MLFTFLIACATPLTNPTRAVHDYEWFHTSYNTIQAKTHQIVAHQDLITAETDKEELQRLRVELSGMKQSCRQLVADYNGNSDKVNVGIFQGSSLPNHIEPSVCETN